MIRKRKFNVIVITGILVFAFGIVGCGESETIPDDYNVVPDVPEIPGKPDNPGTSEEQKDTELSFTYDFSGRVVIEVQADTPIETVDLSKNVNATNASSDLSFSFASSADVPDWLKLSSDGKLSGTPSGSPEIGKEISMIAKDGEGKQGKFSIILADTGRFVKINGVVNVSPDYLIYNSEVTGKEWREVWNWATDEERGDRKYTFTSSIPGGNGDNQPAEATILDTLLWINAKSEKDGLTPVYRFLLSPIVGAEPVIERNAGTISGKISNLKENGKITVSDAYMNKEATNGYRLPERGEWQEACECLEKATYGIGSDGTIITAANLGDYAVYKNNSNGMLSDVRTRKPNKLGLYDMSGNAEEWVWERIKVEYDYNYFIKGGNYNSPASECTASALADAVGNPLAGFRLARTVARDSE